ncbi:hypothetical protein MGYG_01146 [Nannizzia gypsea CBS 118893]|uniref:Uncharacterized protein n=1 Tax=Arthroderma gypseum (strain ATCC MYA-4604 / CBS 118893) TaxID=535722 RepID=E5QYY5_ARTGP|nr:hypothetical protein MGYG_01146 [Nannizzia gypsea CBS 118893]EFQ98108.1 hypothetical protein MGYG_01146 [Nannizzia gypsea CBS 118893]
MSETKEPPNQSKPDSIERSNKLTGPAGVCCGSQRPVAPACTLQVTPGLPPSGQDTVRGLAAPMQGTAVDQATTSQFESEERDGEKLEAQMSESAAEAMARWLTRTGDDPQKVKRPKAGPEGGKGTWDMHFRPTIKVVDEHSGSIVGYRISGQGALHSPFPHSCLGSVETSDGFPTPSATQAFPTRVRGVELVTSVAVAQAELN